MKLYIVTNLENSDVVGLTADEAVADELVESLEHMDTRVQAVDFDHVAPVVPFSIELEDTPAQVEVGVHVANYSVLAEGNARPLTFRGQSIGAVRGLTEYTVELTCVVERAQDVEKLHHIVRSGWMKVSPW